MSLKNISKLDKAYLLIILSGVILVIGTYIGVNYHNEIIRNIYFDIENQVVVSKLYSAQEAVNLSNSLNKTYSYKNVKVECIVDGRQVKYTVNRNNRFAKEVNRFLDSRHLESQIDRGDE